MFWLTYRKNGRLLGVFILEGGDLLQMRFGAAVYGLDQGANFAEGHPLDPATAKSIPAHMIRHMLSLYDARKLLTRLERAKATKPGRRTI
jgi:hypothetical protein